MGRTSTRHQNGTKNQAHLRTVLDWFVDTIDALEATTDLERMLKEHARLLVWCCLKYAQHLPIDHALDHAIRIFMIAGRTYDPSKGTTFSTLYVRSFCVALKDTRRTSPEQRMGLVHTPVHHRLPLKRLREKMGHIHASEGRWPSLHELQEAGHIKPGEKELLKVARSLDAFKPTFSLEHVNKDADDPTSLSATVCTVEENPEELAREEVIEAVRRAFGCLREKHPRWAQVIDGRFWEDKPLRSIKMGVSYERVRQIQERALEELKIYLLAEGVDEETFRKVFLEENAAWARLSTRISGSSKAGVPA